MAELLLFQKNDSNLKFLKERLDSFPKHKIYLEQHSLTASLEALDHIQQIQLRDLPMPDAIVLDGNFLTDAYPCSDAETIINRRHELGISIHIIGYSAVYLSQHMDELKIHPGLDIGKNPNNLFRVLDELFER